MIDGSSSFRVQHSAHKHDECAIHDDTPWPEGQCHYISHCHLCNGQGDPMEINANSFKAWLYECEVSTLP